MSTPSVTPPEQSSPAPRKRLKKRTYIPLILLGLLVLAAIAFYVRGTWADTAVKNPATIADGAITQLLREPDGNVVVRCGVVVDAPPPAVWAVVTGYEKHHEFLPYVSKVDATKQADGRLLIDGVAHSRLWGDWPFQSMVTHREMPDKDEFSALWKEENVGPFRISRGHWNVSPAGNKNQTLLVLTLQIELKDHADFIVRNVLMDRMHTILKAMRDQTLERKKA